MPKFTPLRAITVTMLLPGTPAAASVIDLHAAIEMFKKKWSLPATKARALRTASAATPESSSANVSRLNNSAEAAALRLCNSSPMCRAWAISGLRSGSASPRTATCMVSKNSPPSQRSRSSTSGELAPNRSTLPKPSLRLQYARFPAAVFSTTHTGMDGLMMPAIGPTALCSWHGSRATAPLSASFSAASRSSAQPSYRMAPAMAPRCGPHMSGQSIGGPECRMRRSPGPSPAIASPARTRSTSRGCAARYRS